MKTTHTEFERYYQQVRSRQKRDAVCWSLLLLALYFAAGSAAEFNLLTIWHSLPHFFDYMAETIPPLSAGNLFADVQTKGSLARWGYRLPIQLPLIWETLQLALASTTVAVAIATVSRFLPPITHGPRRRCALPFACWWRFTHHARAGVGGDLCDGVRHRRDPGLSGADAAYRRQPDQTVLRGGGKRAKQTGTRHGGLRRVPAAENSLRPVAAGETAVSLLRLYAA